MLLSNRLRILLQAYQNGKPPCLNTFLIYTDAISEAEDDWDTYIEKLQRGGFFRGGSSIGQGECVRKSGATP
jgi:hypothetical protein